MSDIIKKIKSAGHFDVSIAPATFVAKRVPNVLELAPLVEKCQVQLRGWDFPHINSREAIVPDRPDSVSQETDWGHHLEAWRIFQSGQFTDLRALHTDWFAQYPGGAPKAVAHIESGEILFVEHALFAFAELFEFAARLSNTVAGDERMTIDVSVVGLANRRLAIADPMRMDFMGNPRARIAAFPQSFSVSRAELRSDTEKLAVGASQALFGMFGEAIATDVLVDWLSKLKRL